MRFEALAREHIRKGEHAPLIRYGDALHSVPTPDHYLPLPYVLGAADDADALVFSVEGVDGGSVSMLTVQLG